MREVGGRLGGGDKSQLMGHNKSLQLGLMQLPFGSLKPRRLLIDDLASVLKLLTVSGPSMCCDFVPFSAAHSPMLRISG